MRYRLSYQYSFCTVSEIPNLHLSALLVQYFILIVSESQSRRKSCSAWVIPSSVPSASLNKNSNKKKVNDWKHFHMNNNCKKLWELRLFKVIQKNISSSFLNRRLLSTIIWKTALFFRQNLYPKKKTVDIFWITFFGQQKGPPDVINTEFDLMQRHSRAVI